MGIEPTDGNGAWMNPYDLTCAQEFPATDTKVVGPVPPEPLKIFFFSCNNK